MCNVETGNIPAIAPLPRKVDWNLTPSSSLKAITCKVQQQKFLSWLITPKWFQNHWNLQRLFLTINYSVNSFTDFDNIFLFFFLLLIRVRTFLSSSIQPDCSSNLVKRVNSPQLVVLVFVISQWHAKPLMQTMQKLYQASHQISQHQWQYPVE